MYCGSVKSGADAGRDVGLLRRRSRNRVETRCTRTIPVHIPRQKRDRFLDIADFIRSCELAVKHDQVDVEAKYFNV
jgi:cobalamin-dependent methionine synthase I